MKIFYNKAFKNYFLLMLTLFSVEIIFRLVMGIPVLDIALLRILIGVNIIGLILGTINSLFGRIIGNVLTILCSAIWAFYAVLQAGVIKYLDRMMSFAMIKDMQVFKVFLDGYNNDFPSKIFLVFIPVVLLVIYYFTLDNKIRIMQENETIDFSDKFDSIERKELNTAKYLKENKRKNITDRVGSLVFAIILCFVYYGTLSFSFMQDDLQFKTNKELFYNPDMTLLSVKQFGTSGYAIVDLKSNLFSKNKLYYTSGYEKEYSIKEQENNEYKKSIDDNVWKEIIKEEGNSNYKTLSNYYISQEVTPKNEYTGIFKNKNLIVIMMESVNDIVLNEKYFPNITKLYNEGWTWTNSYSSRSACSTGNSEFSGMTSLYGINNSCSYNKYKNNKYANSIFNLFNNKDYVTSSYYGYTNKYYNRNVVHPNMGSMHYYSVEEMGISYKNVYGEWTDDGELIDNVLEMTEIQDRFMAWVTTSSTDQPYVSTSLLGEKYIDLFDGTKYDLSMKRYLSKLKVLDNAIGKLLNGLEEQNKLDDTVIVLYSDNYPYGLTKSNINSYLEYDVMENNNIDKTPFVIYNSKMTPRKFDKYTSYVNILPTIANLFDMDYDPRLYAGKDILSNDYEGRAIFNDGSWKDKIAYYDASLSKVTFYQNSNKYTDDEIKKINEDIKNRIEMANLAIKTNYFDYLYNKMDEKKIKVID